MNLKLKQKLLVWVLLTFTITRAQSSVESALQELSADLEQWKREAMSKFQETERRAETAEAETLALKRALEEIRVPPIGFIYIEYGNQASPGTLWPTGSWTDVSSSYAGLFFRAVGGDAHPFGANQEDSSPRITYLQFQDNKHGDLLKTDIPLNYNDKDSGYKIVKTGGYAGSWTGLQVYTRGGEVRPKNQAVRLWQRTA